MKLLAKKIYINIIFSNQKKYLIASIAFKAISFLYLVFIKMLRFWRIHGQHSLDKQIISVGNITWGGTGKTPVVIEVSNYLASKGKKVAVIHHGRSAADEAELLNLRLPGARVCQERTKLKSLHKIGLDDSIDIVVLDDGYQNWNIKRDLDILCLNFNRPFGNGFLIPGGSLREEISALKRANIILINKTLSVDNFYYFETVKKYNQSAEIIFTRYRIENLQDITRGVNVSQDSIKGIPSAFATAVADPDYVRVMLSQLGVSIKNEFIYPDHHIFSRKDIAYIAGKVSSEVKMLFFTEKDYVKFRGDLEFFKQTFNGKLLVLVKIGLDYLSNEKALYRGLDILLDSPFR
ncbi:MAG: tetraacyldisaccharide 4'-kinase [Candidatus Omnitrophica bacterium]|nr:tetraacyldisaccharide 4'-kinase [Candidatus Omnitrophota bacterium]